MTVVFVLVASRAKGDRGSKLAEVLRAQFHHLTMVPVLADHVVPTNTDVGAVPLFVYCGRITQPTHVHLRTVDVVAKDVTELVEHDPTDEVLIPR